MDDLKSRLTAAAREADLSRMDTADAYNFIVRFVKDSVRTPVQTEGRRAYYLSSEFLMGRLTEANLFNLGIRDSVYEALREAGFDPERLLEIPDAALGNGGLGRLAACFLEAAATHRIPLFGYGLRYRYGLFKQDLAAGYQREEADDWTKYGDPWSDRRESDAVEVTIGGERIRAVPYDMPVYGYEGAVGNLRLWQAEAVRPFDFAAFDAGRYAEASAASERASRLTAVLYPNDNTPEGKQLRLSQQIFLTAATVEDVLRSQERAHESCASLAEYAVLQLNDTHPVLAIPMLITALERRGMPFAEALETARRTFAYTNHTVMTEALEVWDAALLQRLSPEAMGAIGKIQQALEREYPDRTADMNIIDGGRVHMARLATYVSFAVNGVAPLHTEILTRRVLAPWYERTPGKFSNKTNGVTQRRFLAVANPPLASFITERIGDGWVKNFSEVEKLRPYLSDAPSLRDLAAVKRENKQRLCRRIAERCGEKLDADFLFDIQVKRLHEYKRQLLNALSIVYFYQGLRDGSIPDFTPTAFLFGAKSAPGYHRAKGIIRYILEIAKRVNGDPLCEGRMRVIFVPDYNVSWAEVLIPAGDLSEQISMAGTEASGTGNMKFMMNGAPTLGTYDGANLEILRAVGEENNYFFGARAEEIIAEREANAYDPRRLYAEDGALRRAVDTLIDGTFDDGGTGAFRDLYTSLLDGAPWHRADHYRVLGDFRSYVEAKSRAGADYRDTEGYARRALANIAASGEFSADRTVKEYAKEIWRV
ncbi:MAG: glycogen/starch/alpha-glucan family phosphorylase [Clostridia bacterium]|nr:glycogen/starch/alpha-glucan family phosphorylase [Clostridia bacterium]